MKPDLYEAIESVLADHPIEGRSTPERAARYIESLRTLWLRDRAALASPDTAVLDAVWALRRVTVEAIEAEYARLSKAVAVEHGTLSEGTPSVASHAHRFKPVGDVKVCDCGLTLNEWSAALTAKNRENR